MNTHGGIADAWMGFGEVDGIMRFLQIRACDHELLAAHVTRTLKDIFEVVLVGLLVVVATTKDRIAEVYANLRTLSVLA